ncbi:recombinase family protein [Kitasatospora sp. NPDC092286]|uniref:recombinase family protein n=1 Tax=Kitasatospora sp. NPDC092286 TaxID=3364087 RepID=UPI00380B23AC
MAPRIFGFADAAKRALLEDEAQVVRSVVERRTGGEPFAVGAASLRNAGFVGTLGSPFTGKTMARLLRNPAIAGLTYDADGNLVDAGHPGIITPAQFAELQKQDAAEAAKKEKDGKPAEATPDYDYLFGSTDLVTCGMCGASTQGLRTNAGHPGYCCPDGPRADRPGDCGKVRISAGLLEDHAGEQIVARLMLPGTQEALEAARDEARRELEVHRARLAEVRATVDSLGTMVLRKQITAKSAGIAKNEAARETKALNRAIRRLERAAATPVTGSVDELVTWWNTAPSEAKAGLALLMLYRIDIFQAGRGTRTIKPGRVKLWWRHLPPPPDLRTAA